MSGLRTAVSCGQKLQLDLAFCIYLVKKILIFSGKDQGIFEK